MLKPLCAVFLLAFAFTVHSQKIKVVVDERVELITVMQLLYEYPLVGKADIRYRQEVQDYFGRHANDSSVLYFLRIAEQYFSFVKPINYTLHYSIPAFKQVEQFSAHENIDFGFAQHVDSLKLYIKAVKQFYEATNFHAFFVAHKAFYDSLVFPIQQKIDSTHLARALEGFYGLKQHSYTLIVSPLFIDAGMSTWIQTVKGNDLYSIIGSNTDSKGFPDFDIRWLVQYLVVHEFSHPFTNPLVDKYYTALEKDSCLFAPIKKTMKREGNATWKTTLQEILNRACEITLDKLLFGKADADSVLADYTAKQYRYLPGLLPVIEDYAQKWDKHKSLEGVMPEVIRYFDSLATACK